MSPNIALDRSGRWIVIERGPRRAQVFPVIGWHYDSEGTVYPVIVRDYDSVFPSAPTIARDDEEYEYGIISVSLEEWDRVATSATARSRADLPHHLWSILRGAGDGKCPHCGHPSFYVRAADRYFHDDGSSNLDCWRQVTRGANRD